MFKKLFTSAVNTVLVPDEVVHAEVYSSSDILEKESQEFLDKCNAQISEAERTDIQALSSLGFGSAKNIQPHVMQLEKAREAKSEIEIIQKYKESYPFYKFITEECATSICEKYNLYLASASKFIGAIPAKNQKEIIDFRVSPKDVDTLRGESSFWIGSSIAEFERLSYRKPERKEDKTSGINLKIIAPLDQLQMEKRDIIRNRRIVSTDPIVLQPVYGGYLIVTVWGAEANDVAIQNESLN